MMHPYEVREARQALGLTLGQLAALLGFSGSQTRQKMYQIEMGERDMNASAYRLLQAYLDGYRPHDWAEIARGTEIQEVETR